MEASGEKAIDGVTSGLINLNETVTWQAKHLFKTRVFKSKISAMQPPVYFEDEMIESDFKSVRHEHHFKAIANGTIMIDLFYFEVPYGNVGKLANKIFLTSYLQRLLENRNKVIKEYAETTKWQSVLEKAPSYQLV
jgi:ligand-binding SRPBCC domain-containing protein